MDSMLIVCGVGALIVAAIVLIKKYRSEEIGDAEAKLQKKYREKIESYIEPANVNSLPLMERLVHCIRKNAVGINECSTLKDEAIKLWRISEESDQPLMVLVMGEFKTGKSTFINALLGKDVLKTDVAPATAVVSILRYGEKPLVQLHHEDGIVTKYAFDKLEEITAEGDASKQALRDSLEYVEIFYPNEMLKKINLVDTPGLNVHRDSHIKSTQKFQSTADVVLWVFNATRSVTRTEIAEIEALGVRLKPFAIVNRIDNIDEEEETIEEVLNNIRKRLGDFVHEVIGVSARQACEAVVNRNDVLLEESGWRRFLAKLEDHFIECSAHLKLTSIKGKIKEFTASFESNLKSQEKANLEKEKYFSDQQTAVADVNNAIGNIDKAETAAFRGQQYIEGATGRFMTKYKDVTCKKFDETKDLSNMADELLSCITNFMPAVEILENHEEAKPIIDNIKMLYDEIDKDAVRFRSWFSYCQELSSESNEIKSENYCIEQLRKEYEKSGLFGGTPIFDFSGRKERLDKTIKARDRRVSRFKDSVESHWRNYKSICLDVIEKNKDVSKVGKKAEEILTRTKAGYEAELYRLENDFEKERARYMEIKQELADGQNILKELNDIVAIY